MTAMLETPFVELYLHIRNNPLLKIGRNSETARIYSIDMERLLARAEADVTTECVQLSAQGYSYREIADKLKKSPSTVRRMADRISDWEAPPL